MGRIEAHEKLVATLEDWKANYYEISRPHLNLSSRWITYILALNTQKHLEKEHEGPQAQNLSSRVRSLTRFSELPPDPELLRVLGSETTNLNQQRRG